ncbi:MAG: GxxExxY protein [Gemmatimonadaceae bacterium]|nr:GxxExxY protein [Gemmatimonadaceae bacterium]
MRDDYDPLSFLVIGEGIHVHKRLGPDLLESAYEECLGWRLLRCGIRVRRQVVMPLVFEGYRIRAAYRVDMIVAEQLIVEIKCVERFLPVHEAQLRTYLRMSGLKVGLLFNFKTAVLKDGIRRITV